MELSFVIPAHNEERYVGATVRAIHEAAGAVLGPDARAAGRYEVVVAADACSDRTAEVAREAGAIVVLCENRQISKTRNTGWKAARGRMLIFVDADTIVSAATVGEAVAAIRDGATGGGAGCEMDRPVPMWARVMLETLLVLFRWLRWTGGCFLFCRREALETVGGWDETIFAGEEIHLSQALKGLHGRRKFVIIRSRVVTSARKVVTYSGWEILKMSLWIVLRGRKGVSSRQGLELWYQRRDEPA